MKQYGEKIKQIRVEKGITAVEVAKAAGLKHSSYGSIEKGITKSISIEVGKGIAKALGVSFIELFDVQSPESSAFQETLAENKRLQKRIAELESQIQDKSELLDMMRDEKEFTLLVMKWIIHYVTDYYLEQSEKLVQASGKMADEIIEKSWLSAKMQYLKGKKGKDIYFMPDGHDQI